jgi:hypothetical protein
MGAAQKHCRRTWRLPRVQVAILEQAAQVQAQSAAIDLGWAVGLEPTTTGLTVRSSAY